MTLLALASVLLLLTLTDLTGAIQVSPDSPCAPVCIDNPNSNVADPDASTTFGSDITCIDEHYGNTPKGQKFVSCLNCLQTSTASSSGESDQEWFLYNLRYTLDSCLFGLDNASDAKSSVCTTSKSCGPLQTALENGNLVPTNESEYSYCTADGNAFRGSYLGSCQSCFEDSDDQQYLRNFLIALDAGCDQRTPSGTLLGIQGSVFSTTPVNKTYPGYHKESEDPNPKRKKKLSNGAIIGIAVGLAVLLAGVIAIFFYCFWEKRQAKRRKRLTSNFDERYGAKNITSPTDGAYGNPYSNSSPPIKAVDPYGPNALSAQERAFIGQDRAHFSQPIPFPPEANDPDHWQNTSSSHSSPNPPPSYANPQIPTHEAYISPPISPEITASTHAPENIQLSPYSSPYSTPRNPPSVQTAQSARSSPRQIQPSLVQIQNNRTSPPGPPSQASSPPSQVSPPLEQRPPSRTASRGAESARRGTRAMGIGNVNASMEVPVKISGPVERHGGRFDFVLASRERRQREGNESFVLEKRRKADESPDGEEQWPGAY